MKNHMRSLLLLFALAGLYAGEPDHLTVTGAIRFPQVSAAPSTPPAGHVAVYVLTDGKTYSKNDQGAQTDLTATGAGGSGVADPGANGIMARTAANVSTARTITAGDGVAVTNGDGVAGNPTVALNVAGLTTEDRVQPAADFVAMRDTSAAVNRKATLAALLTGHRDFVVLQEEFWNTGDALTGVLSTVSGTGAAVAVATGDTNHPGVINLTTGTTATGRAAFASHTSAVRLSGGAVLVSTIFRLTTLSDGTETYSLRSGLGDSVSAEFTDGVFVRYTHSVNAGKFQFVTRSNNVETATDSTVTVAAATWYRCDFTINAAGTTADCTINGTVCTQSSTNIPTAAGRELGVVPLFVLKSLGIVARTFDLDYFRLVQQFDTQR